MRTSALRWLGVAALGLLCGCSGTDDELRRELNAARAAWSSHAIDDYDVRETMSCFCPPPSRWITHVRAGQVESVQLIGDPATWGGDPDAARQRALEQSRSVDDAFRKIDDLIGTVASLEVTYDETYGFPTSIAVDQILEAIDDESTRTMADLVVVESVGR
ncbi:MAG: hypothetical protein DHS20C21_19540 [Gemmatimonadota bacterium]|nr:MAG: hypothetical protein DHS20C21_19540 [Gemmatimonadota bacterium]